MTMQTKAKSLLTTPFLLAATTVVVTLLKMLLNLNIDVEVAQRIVLRVVARFLGQDALNTAEAVPA